MRDSARTAAPRAPPRADPRPRPSRARKHGGPRPATARDAPPRRARPDRLEGGAPFFPLSVRRIALIAGPQPPFSLVIPAYNQRRRVVESAHEARAHLDDVFGTRAELIVVDDGSRREECPEERDLPERTKLVRHVRNEGKGSAVRSGIMDARGEYVVFTDSDLPFTLEPLETTVAWLREGADLVIGDRLLEGSECVAEVTPMRQLSSLVFTFMVTRIVGLPFTDTQCGYKGYRLRAAHQLYARLRTLSFAFDVEILARARALGYSIRRQPLRLVNNDDTTVRLSRHAPRMLFDMLRIAWHVRHDDYV